MFIIWQKGQGYTNNLRYADDTTLMAQSEEELQSFLVKVKGEWKSWLKTQHSKNKDPITSWQIGGETMETVTGFIFLGFQITVDGDCSYEIKRPLLLGRNSLEKTLVLGKIEGRRRKGWQKMRWLDGNIYSMDMRKREWSTG